MKNQIIETIGYISKVETVTTLDHNIMPNTLVLEDVEPFPGYHGANLPNDQPPMSIFLVTKEKYSFEEISRAANVVKNKIKLHFDAVYGELKIANESLPSIRVMGLKEFQSIPKIQELFEKEGLKFIKKRPVKECAIIKIHKTFLIKEIETGIFQDMVEPEMRYIQINKKLGWDTFQKVTINIKNNIDYSNFDAALGYIYRHDGIIDIIRIYGKNITIENLINLQDLYIKEVKNIQWKYSF